MGDNYDISQHYVDPEVRAGLTTEQAEDLHRPEKFGYNELPAVEVSKLWMFLFQFMGTMPYMLELAALVSAAARDWKDFGILLFMLSANGILGFHEELKCLESLVSTSFCIENFLPFFLWLEWRGKRGEGSIRRTGWFLCLSSLSVFLVPQFFSPVLSVVCHHRFSL